MSALQTVTDLNFKDEIEKGVVLVDFSADWCGPCKMLHPILEGVAQDMNVKDTVKFLKLDVDDNPETAKIYNIMSLPTVIIFKEGVQMQKFVGTAIGQKYLNELKALL